MRRLTLGPPSSGHIGLVGDIKQAEDNSRDDALLDWLRRSVGCGQTMRNGVCSVTHRVREREASVVPSPCASSLDLPSTTLLGVFCTSNARAQP